MCPIAPAGSASQWPSACCWTEILLEEVRQCAGTDTEDTVHEYYVIAGFFCCIYLVVCLIERELPKE